MKKEDENSESAPEKEDPSREPKEEGKLPLEEEGETLETSPESALPDPPDLEGEKAPPKKRKSFINRRLLVFLFLLIAAGVAATFFFPLQEKIKSFDQIQEELSDLNSLLTPEEERPQLPDTGSERGMEPTQEQPGSFKQEFVEALKTAPRPEAPPHPLHLSGRVVPPVPGKKPEDAPQVEPGEPAGSEEGPPQEEQNPPLAAESPEEAAADEPVPEEIVPIEELAEEPDAVPEIPEEEEPLEVARTPEPEEIFKDSSPSAEQPTVKPQMARSKEVSAYLEFIETSVRRISQWLKEGWSKARDTLAGLIG